MKTPRVVVPTVPMLSMVSIVSTVDVMDRMDTMDTMDTPGAGAHRKLLCGESGSGAGGGTSSQEV